MQRSRYALSGLMCAVLVASTLSLVSATARADEPAPQANADVLLGLDARGENWTVAPVVHSDGFVWIFDVKTPYGDYQVSGLRRMEERAQDLRALQALELMSRTKVFGDAMVNAGLAPIRFGRDLVLDPVETVGNLVSGVGTIFDKVVSNVQNPGGSRDPFFDSVTGITKAERDLAFALNVDPYTDFKPLRSGLEDVARATAAGDLPITAAFSAITGGAGIAVQAASTASGVAAPYYLNTSRQIAEIVTKNLVGLGIDEVTTKKFVENSFYSPADELVIAGALGTLGAANPSVFIERAALADSFDVAKFNRYRAELLVKESAHLGTLKEFVLVSGLALNRDASGRLVAAFPFDEVAWTETVSRNLTRVSADIVALGETRPPLFASNGTLSATARSELKKLGWETVALE